MVNTITVKNLTKRYGPVEAVNNVSFSVGGAQVLGFLGPNGAGKTTIMKILTGFHFPSGGSARIDGVSVEENPVEVKKRVGYLPETAPLYGDLSPDEYLDFIVRARLIPRERRREAVDRAVAACGLENYRNRRIDTLSKGYRQRVGLAQAIVHDPPILILDEPTSGLDPNQIIEIRSLIRELGRSKTVILSTHILQEVEAVCSRVLILNEGRIAAQGTPEEIGGAIKGGETWELTLKLCPAPPPGEEIFAPLRVLGDLSLEGEAEAGKGLCRLRLTVRGGLAEGEAGIGEKIFDWAVASGCKILGMSRKTVSLEDIFVRLTADGAAEKTLGGTA